MKQNTPSIKPSTAVAAFYETYGAAFASTRHAPWDVFHRIAQIIRPGDTVVDVGAGNARFVMGLPMDIRYIGVEPSSTLRSAARVNIAHRNGSEMREGGFPSVPVPDASANVTACIAVLHHLMPDERAAAMCELVRITKPGGTVVITVWNLHGWRMRGLKTWLAAWLRLPLVRGGGRGDVWVDWKADGACAPRYVHAFTRGELRELCTQANLRIMESSAWSNGPTSLLRGRNLLLIAQKK